MFKASEDDCLGTEFGRHAACAALETLFPNAYHHDLSWDDEPPKCLLTSLISQVITHLLIPLLFIPQEGRSL